MPAPPFAHLKLDEGQGLVAHDSVAGHDGQIFGAADWVSSVDFVGRARRILTLPGAAGDYAALSGSEDFPTSGGFTLACRIKTLVYPGVTAVVIGKVDCAAGAGFAMTLVDLGGPQAVLLLAWINGIVFALFPPSTDGLEGRWHHIVLTFSSLGVARGYLDGVPGTTTSGLGPIPPSATRINIGRTGDIGGGVCAGVFENFNGEIDDVYIYDRELTAEEIRLLAIGDAPRGAIWSPGERFIHKGVIPGAQVIVTPAAPFPAGQAKDLLDVIRVEHDVLVVDRATGFLTPYGPVPPKLVSLPFEEGEGLVTANFGGAGYHGQLKGNLAAGGLGPPPEWISVAAGTNYSRGRYALRFNQNHVDLSVRSAGIDPTAAGLVIGAQVRRRAVGVGGAIIGQGPYPSGFALALHPGSGGPILRLNNNIVNGFGAALPIPADGNWHSVAVLIAAAMPAPLGNISFDVYLMVDGAIFTEPDVEITPPFLPSTEGLTVGQASGVVDFDGDIDDVLVFPAIFPPNAANAQNLMFHLQVAQVVPSVSAAFEIAQSIMRASAPGPVPGLPLLEAI
jgi:hypothetical protein